MNCPVCKNVQLEAASLEHGLPAFKCSHCAGIWLMSNVYLRWRRTDAPPIGEEANGADPIPDLDIHTAKICPNCGRLMMRYRVLPNGALVLDRCGQCNGVWFDPDEWAVLVARNLYTRVNEFFTKPWQEHVRAEEAHAMLDKLYVARFGNEDYAKVKELWKWLKSHPQRAMLLAYLQADDPYKV